MMIISLLPVYPTFDCLPIEMRQMLTEGDKTTLISSRATYIVESNTGRLKASTPRTELGGAIQKKPNSKQSQKPVLNWANVCSPEHTSKTSTNYDSFLN